MADIGNTLTFVYKHVGGHPIHLDVYPPQQAAFSSEIPKPSPAVIYFHGGALTVGNRKSWFPSWLHRRVTDSGMAFISADYQLIPPATGHDILSDIKDLFCYIEDGLNRDIREDWASRGRVGHPFEIDPHALAVSGSSAGGLCAYLAAIHASPKPKAVLSLYGMGGDMLTSQYLTPKTEPFFRGREILEPGDFAEFLYPASLHLQPTSDSPLAYHPSTYRIPGYPANPRMLIGRLYLQMGTFLDYYTGSHNPSLSTILGTILHDHAQSHAERGASSQQLAGSPSTPESLRESIPDAHRHLFPQFMVTSSLPPMLLIHGTDDTAVLLKESQNLRSLLEEAGVCVELVVVEGKEHSFDYEPNAEAEFGGTGGLFDRAISFLVKTLASS